VRALDEIVDQHGTLDRDDVVRILERAASALADPRAA
jgi:hypothetical protein